jgi:hypothetical protein
MIKIIVAATLAVTMVFALTSCGNQGGVSGETVTTNQSEEAVTEFATITPPADGWTLETINEVLNVGGKKLSFPFRFGDLGADYSIPEIFDDKNNERLGGTVYYKDKPVFSVTGQYNDEERNLENSLIDTIMMIDEFNYTDLPPEKLLVINDLKIDSDMSEIEEKLGTVSLVASDSTAYQYIYAVGDSNNAIMVGVDENTEKVNTIWVVLSYEVNAEIK